MSNTEIKKIFDFIDGKLGAEEHNLFLSELKESEELQKEVEAVKKMKSFARSKEKETHAKLAVQKVHQKYPSNQKELRKSKPSVLRYLVPIGVAAAVLFGIFFTQGLFNTSPMSNQEIYSTYFDPVDLPLMTRSEQDQKLKLEAENAFNAGEYKIAIEKLEQLKSSEPGNKLYDLSLAISYLDVKQYEKSESFLNELLNDSTYESEALYYLALSKIQQNQRSLATDFLQKINQGSTRYNQAKEIIGKLK